MLIYRRDPPVGSAPAATSEATTAAGLVPVQDILGGPAIDPTRDLQPPAPYRLEVEAENARLAEERRLYDEALYQAEYLLCLGGQFVVVDGNLKVSF
jgi:hypothetical protein